MPRTTYKTRFENLLAKDYISKYDRQFIESLFGYYKSYKKLTSGRRTHFIRLEEKYESRPRVTEEQKDQIATIAELVKKSYLLQDDRGRDILLSFSLQLTSGKSLSPRQIAIIDDKIEMYSQRNIDMAKNWLENWDSDKRTRFAVSVFYYSHTGYFAHIVRKMKANPDYVPTFKEYNSIANNNYSKKVIDGYFKKPKFEPGAQVAKSTNWSRMGKTGLRRRWSGLSSYAADYGDLFVVLEVQPVSPISACKGNKVYKIMDISTGIIYGAEERELKAYKISKNRKK